MRILLFSNLCPPHFLGGYEIGCFNVARALEAEGHTVRLLTTSTWHTTYSDPSFVKREFELNCHLPSGPRHGDVLRYRAHKSRVSCFHNTSVTLEHLGSFCPDVAYIFNLLGVGGIAIIDLLNNLRVPWVWHLMDSIPTQLLEGVPPEILTLFNANGGRLYAGGSFISMSESLVAEIVALGARQVQDATIIPGWIHEPVLTQRSDYCLGRRPKFLFAGSLSESKGVDLILEAIRIAIAAGQANFTVDFFGPGPALDYQNLARAMGIGDTVRFHGPISFESVQRLYRHYDCLLFPTWPREPFGFVALEAAAAGCVPILTSSCGAAERLVDGLHAIKIARCAQELANKLVDVVTGKLDLQRIGRCGAQHVNRTMTLNSLLPKINRVLRTAASGRLSPLSSPILTQQRRLQFLKDARALEMAFP